MKTIDAQTLLTQLRWRYAVKKFDPTKKIPADTWKALEETLVLTPSSYGLQPWKFFVITDSLLKEKLVPASWNQKQIADGSHLVVFAIKKDLNSADVERHISRMMEVRGTPAESLEGFKKILFSFVAQQPPKFDVNVWSAKQIYIAIGNFMTAAALLGIDTCPMEGINPAKYDEILGLGKLGYATSVACVAGYRASDDKYANVPKVRFKLEDVIQHIP